MIWKENIFFRKMFIVADLASLMDVKNIVCGGKRIIANYN